MLGRRYGNRCSAANVPRRPRLHGVRALRRSWRRARTDPAQLLGQLRRDVEPAARDQPRAERRRQRRRRGEHRRRDPPAGKPRAQLRPDELQPQRGRQQRLHRQRARSRVCLAERRPSRPSPATAFSGRHSGHRTADRRTAGRLAAIQRRRAARCHRHGPLDQRRRDGFGAHGRGHARVVRSGHERHVVPHERVPDDGVRRRRASVPGLVVARIRSAAARPFLRRCTGRHVDVDQWHHLVHADGRRQCGGAWTPGHAGAHLRAGQATARVLRPPRGRLTAVRSVRRRAADSERRAPAAPAAHDRGEGRAGRSGGESVLHRVPSLAVPLGSGARRADRSAARVQSAQPADLQGRHVAVHGRLHRRRDRRAVHVRRNQMALQLGRDSKSGLSRHLDGQPRYPPAGQRPLDRLHAAKSSLRPSRHERVRSDAADSGVRPGSGRHAQSEYLHRSDYAGTGRRIDWQLTPPRLDSTQLSGLCPEQQHSHQELSPDDRQPARGRTGVVQTVRAARDARRPRSTEVDGGAHRVRAFQRSSRAN